MSNSKYTDHCDYCTQQVMKHDRERMLCMMMSPQPARAALVSLLAWNLEIAKISEIASEDMVGLIRFQWWRDAIEEIYAEKTPRQHAVVLTIAETIRKHQLAQADLMEIIDIREADLDRAPFENLEALDNYACVTGGGILKLWVRILGISDHNALEAAEHIGSAWALIGTIRACHHLAHTGKIRLPMNVLEAAGIDADRILQEGFAPEVLEAIEAVAELAEEHIRDARALKRDVPKAAYPPLYMAIQAEDFLLRLKASAYNPVDRRMAKGRAYRAMRLWWANIIKKY
ncbi:MAG: squalene/phytoene synthase family protein [Alphaproteobacteria bacterium]|nr:squalene/phytoene synthase family protein [Alphaproteobacteria bacterium]